MRKLFFTIAITLTTLVASAQKLGHINTQALLIDLPAYNQAKLELETFAQEQQAEFEQYAKSYQEKEAKYLAKEKACKADPANCDQDILQLEYNYLMESAQKLEELQYQIEMKIQERETLLINKVIKKIQVAAEAVAKEKGILYVFDSNTTIYAGGEDLNAAVKAKLLEASTTGGN